MSHLEVLKVSSDEIQKLQSLLLKMPAVFPTTEDLTFSSLLISYGIAKEVGTVNDELARFVFDAKSNQLVPLESLKARVVSCRGKVGFQIYSEGSLNLEVRINGFRDLCHPGLGENKDGTFACLTIFPEIVAKLAAHEGVELVIARTWAMNSIFGGFAKNRGYYETNFWELENNDTLLFADLVSQRKLAFVGTHDLIAHIAGLNASAWPELAQNAARVRRAILTYIGKLRPSISDLVLPYTAGVILDDLAQPPSYASTAHRVMLEEILRLLEMPRGALSNTLLLEYPSLFEQVITLSRSSALETGVARAVVADFNREIWSKTAQLT
jgi:hypothetical protein